MTFSKHAFETLHFFFFIFGRLVHALHSKNVPVLFSFLQTNCVFSVSEHIIFAAKKDII